MSYNFVVWLSFLVLFADDLTFRAVGAAGTTDVKTPNIDRLAARGTTFTHAFIQGGTSGAVCVASRAMLMTGRYLWTCGKNGNCAERDKTLYPLWGQVLGDAGYQTFAVGKWHNGKATLEKGFRTTGPGFLGGMLESTKQGGAAYNRPAPGNPWTPDDPKWYMVDLRAVARLKRPVTLAEIKARRELAEMALVRVGRLSVSPVTPAEWETIVAMGS